MRFITEVGKSKSRTDITSSSDEAPSNARRKKKSVTSSTSNQSVTNTHPPSNLGIRKRQQLSKLEMIKVLIAFWIFGLCNNIGYVVMITAARDLIFEISNKASDTYTSHYFKRECNQIGTGVILLANIVPSILIKFVAPFLPLMIHIRMIIVVLLSALGFFLAAFGYDHINGQWLIIFGVIATSLSNGLGECSLLAYTAFFSTLQVVSTWSSGTGAAGVIGALLYSALREAKISGKNSLLIMLMWPILMATTFWGLLKHPYITRAKLRYSELEMATTKQLREDIPNTEDVHTTMAKFKILQRIVLIYTTPYSFTFLFQYVINQALFELLSFPSDLLSLESQYRWYQSLYQIGVLVGRSSLSVIHVNSLWLLAFLQGLNCMMFLLEIIFGYLYYIIICMALILWEGLIGGTSYVNTYRRISTEMPPLQREFSMSFNSFGDAVMITMAGAISVPMHDILCKVENPYEKRKRGQVTLGPSKNKMAAVKI